MLDGAGSAGQPGWANRVSLPLQQTGATRTIVSNPRLNSSGAALRCSALLCAYPSTPARQKLRHPATLGDGEAAETAARVSTTQRPPGCALLAPALLALQLRV